MKESPFKTGALIVDDASILFDDLTQELFRRGSQLRFKARGQSMTPFIHNGDIVLIEPQRPNNVFIGDIVLYRRPWGQYIVHRLIKKNNSTDVSTRGDNMPACDPPVTLENVLGRVIQIENRHRKLRLTGWRCGTYGYLIASFGRVRFRGQVRVTRLLARLYWLIEGRRIA